MASSIISQRWQVYDYNDKKDTKLKKGEVIMVLGTPDFPKDVISLVGDGDDIVSVLYESWKGSFYTQDETDKTISLAINDLSDSLAGQIPKKPLELPNGTDLDDLTLPAGLYYLPPGNAYFNLPEVLEYPGAPMNLSVSATVQIQRLTEYGGKKEWIRGYVSGYPTGRWFPWREADPDLAGQIPGQSTIIENRDLNTLNKPGFYYGFHPSGNNTNLPLLPSGGNFTLQCYETTSGWILQVFTYNFTPPLLYIRFISTDGSYIGEWERIGGDIYDLSGVLKLNANNEVDILQTRDVLFTAPVGRSVVFTGGNCYFNNKPIMQGGLGMAMHTITDVDDPVNSNDAANKHYVDSNINRQIGFTSQQVPTGGGQSSQVTVNQPVKAGDYVISTNSNSLGYYGVIMSITGVNPYSANVMWQGNTIAGAPVGQTPDNPAVLATNANLGDMRTPGFYVQSASSASIVDMPADKPGGPYQFALRVISVATDIYQEFFYSYSGYGPVEPAPGIWVRKFSATTATGSIIGGWRLLSTAFGDLLTNDFMEHISKGVFTISRDYIPANSGPAELPNLPWNYGTLLAVPDGSGGATQELTLDTGLKWTRHLPSTTSGVNTSWVQVGGITSYLHNLVLQVNNGEAHATLTTTDSFPYTTVSELAVALNKFVGFEVVMPATGIQQGNLVFGLWGNGTDAGVSGNNLANNTIFNVWDTVRQI